MISDVLTQPGHMLSPINGLVLWKLLETLQPQDFLHLYIYLFLPSSSSLCTCAHNLNLFFSNAIFMALGFISLQQHGSHCHVLSAASVLYSLAQCEEVSDLPFLISTQILL